MTVAANGVIYYWNGISGWIRQGAIEGVPAGEISTIRSHDLLVLKESLASDDTVITEGCSVNYDIDDELPEPWIARNLTVTG